ncbi:hypothetical protein P7C73_g6243, partial [Tremellales sp. Uapishka_1]
MPRRRSKQAQMYARLRRDQMRRVEESRARAEVRRGGGSRTAEPDAPIMEDVDMTMDDAREEGNDGEDGEKDDWKPASSSSSSSSSSEDETGSSDGKGYKPPPRKSKSPRKSRAEARDREAIEKERTPSQNPPPPPPPVTPTRTRNVPAGTPRTPSGRVIRNGARSEEYIMANFPDAVERRRRCKRCTIDGLKCLGAPNNPSQRCYTCASGRCTHYHGSESVESPATRGSSQIHKAHFGDGVGRILKVVPLLRAETDRTMRKIYVESLEKTCSDIGISIRSFDTELADDLRDEGLYPGDMSELEEVEDDDEGGGEKESESEVDDEDLGEKGSESEDEDRGNRERESESSERAYWETSESE